jgi:hypothetical protein
MPRERDYALDTQAELDEIRRRLMRGLNEYRSGKLAKESGEDAVSRAFAKARIERRLGPRP